MTTGGTAPRRTFPVWIGPALAGAALAALAVTLALAGAGPVRAAVEDGLALIRAAGPGWYFLAMALVPLPLAWFTVPAGEAFAAQLSLGGVIAASLTAVAVQLSVSYVAARYVLRPAIERLVRRRGIAVPRVRRDNAVSVALLVRLTPGPPMILGTCVLAVAEMPFGRYLLVSWSVALPWVLGGVVLGRGALAGDFKLLLAGAGLVVAAAVGVRWARRRLAARAAS